MLTLVIGGSASGKSAYAERLAAAGRAPRCYLATMQIWDEECRARVAKHRAARAGGGYTTVERPLDVAGAAAALDSYGTILVEDLGNLAANELYDPQGAGPDAERVILAGIDALIKTGADVIVVSNEVFCGGTAYAGDTDAYLRLLAALHCALAQRADAVCEVVCGLPVYHKGGALP